jgi:poly(3-hydroxybutyrate) depolymerase
LLVHGAGHSWPSPGNAGFDGTALIWEFFEQHPMPD